MKKQGRFAKLANWFSRLAKRIENRFKKLKITRRKISICFLGLFMGVFSFTSSIKMPVPLPENVESPAVVEAMMKQAGLDWIVTDTQVWVEGQTSYLLSKDSQAIAVLVSGKDTSGKFVSLTFSPLYKNEYSLPRDEWQSAIDFATLWYGGFDSSHIVYYYFSSEYGVENSVAEQKMVHAGANGQTIRQLWWKSKVSTVDCGILVTWPDMTKQDLYLGGVLLAENMEGHLAKAITDTSSIPASGVTSSAATGTGVSSSIAAKKVSFISFL